MFLKFRDPDFSGLYTLNELSHHNKNAKLYLPIFYFHICYLDITAKRISLPKNLNTGFSNPALKGEPARWKKTSSDDPSRH